LNPAFSNILVFLAFITTMMKIHKLIVILLLIPFSLLAQKDKPWNKPLYDAYPFHFGFAFTGGVLDFSVTHSDAFVVQDSIRSIEGKSRFLFGASIVGSLRLTDNLDLRFLPGLYFGQRDLEYLVRKNILPNSSGDEGYTFHTMKIESTFLQFPLLLKYRSSRQNNYRPYLVGGLNYTIDLAARKKIKEEEQPKIRLNRNDLLVEMGFGIDYYLPFFKFTTEWRFSYGLMNMVTYDNTGYTESFNRLGTKMVTMIIYFE